MTPTVFFSWQSDSLSKIGRDFISSALTDALKEKAVVEEVLRVDCSAEGESGTPDLPSTIFEKLTQAAVAVFDVTPVGQSIRKERALPNPNVLLELGFAAGIIGWHRVILVMNTFEGRKPEDLPFDLRHRRFPITYLSRTGGEQRAKEKLTGKFREYVGLALNANHLALDRVRKRLSVRCSHFIENFGKSESFPWADSVLGHELHRMIDIGLLSFDIDPTRGEYAYHWTYLGKELCKWYFNKKDDRS